MLKKSLFGFGGGKKGKLQSNVRHRQKRYWYQSGCLDEWQTGRMICTAEEYERGIFRMIILSEAILSVIVRVAL